MADKVNHFVKNKTIILPICETRYSDFMNDKKYAKLVINEFFQKFPELFHKEQQNFTYILHGKTAVSQKQNIALRRIKIGGEVFQICPSFLFPYMVGKTEDIEKALFLLKFHVPFWALTHVFGKDDNYWYRIYCHIGCYNIVGTTIKNPEKLRNENNV